MPAQSFVRVVKLARTLPGVEESLSYGTPALKVRNKFMCRLKEDGATLAYKCASMDEKEFLLASDPAVFFETDHYKGWPSLLIRLDRITDAALLHLLEQVWRREAGKKLVAAYDQLPGPLDPPGGDRRGAALIPGAPSCPSASKAVATPPLPRISRARKAGGQAQAPDE